MSKKKKLRFINNDSEHKKVLSQLGIKDDLLDDCNVDEESLDFIQEIKREKIKYKMKNDYHYDNDD